MAADADKKSDAAGKTEDGVKTTQELQSLKWIRERRSIREFTGEKIPDDHIELILEAARHAPSPENMLMMRFIVIRDDQSRITRQAFSLTMPNLLACGQIQR